MLDKRFQMKPKLQWQQKISTWKSRIPLLNEGIGPEYDPESPPKGSPLTDYNEVDPYNEDPIPALKKRTNGKEADRETKKIALETSSRKMDLR